MPNEKFYVTKEGYNDLVKEHEELVHKTRAEVIVELQEARAQGDLSENADYDAAREHQAQVEARIRELEALIKNSEIIEESDGKKKAAKNAVVKLGSVVTLKDLSDNVESTFSIVGSIEADPLNGKLSNNTPLAEAILDHKVGDVVRFYAKITKFYGNYQLTDVRINDPSYPFEILSSGEEECIALGYEYDIDPVALDPNAVMSDESLNDYQGNLVSTTVRIEDSENFVTSYINNSNVTVYTVHAYLNEYSIDIRLEGHSFFNSENAIKAVFESGKLYDVKVLVSFYKANEEDNGDYQLEFPSFRATEFRNYVSEHVEE